MSIFFSLMLILSTVLCALVAGFLFSLAVVVMPGLRNLADGEYIHAFQQIDGVIQRGNPLFGLVWIGSALALCFGLAVGLGMLDGLGKGLMATCTGAYLFGVQLPTILVNIPLNNALQKVDLGAEDEVGLHTAREAFEERWNRWNTIRTCIAVFVTVTLVFLVSRS